MTSLKRYNLGESSIDPKYKRETYINRTKERQPKDKGQESPPQEKLKNKGLPIVENHGQAVITKVLCVICTPPKPLNSLLIPLGSKTTQGKIFLHSSSFPDFLLF